MVSQVGETTQWVRLRVKEGVHVKQIHIYETFNPGSVGSSLHPCHCIAAMRDDFKGLWGGSITDLRCGRARAPIRESVMEELPLVHHGHHPHAT